MKDTMTEHQKQAARLQVAQALAEAYEQGRRYSRRPL
jgi:hypothetical protein